MGNACANILKETPLVEFRKLDPRTRVEDVEVPAPAKERKCTDKHGFVITAILLITLISLVVYAFVKSDVRRLYYGVDSCGNLCGVKNAKIPGIDCSGKDYTNKTHEMRILATNETFCSDNCDLKPTNRVRHNDEVTGIIAKIFRNVFSEKQLRDLAEFFLESGWKIPISIAITILLTTFTLFMFRYFAAVICWIALVLVLVLLLALSILAWLSYSRGDVGIFAPIIVTVILVLLIIVLVVVRKRIKLMIQIFEETGRALFAMPLLIFLPFFVLLLQLLAFVLWLLTTAIMLTVGEFSRQASGQFHFAGSKLMTFALVFNIIMLVWIEIFYVGAHYMVTAGSVAQWFFKKRKGTSAVCRSVSITIKYHLGTVLFGTFLLTIIFILKMLAQLATSNDKVRVWVECITDNVEALIKFLSQNAYAETAIHGQSFCRSAKRGAKLLLTHLVSLVVVNCVGDCILGVISFFLVAIGTLIAYALFMNDNHVWIGVIICCVFSIVIVATVYETLESVIDTIFLCYCEDKTINDGVLRPYCMSDNLRKFVDTVDELFSEKEKAKEEGRNQRQ